MPTRRRLAVVLTAGTLLSGTTAGASAAAWTVAGSGAATARAGALLAATAPAATASGSTVTVTWTPASAPPGTTHVVTRGGGAPLAGCSATSCTETGVPAGSYTYSIVPVLGNWRGAPVTAQVTVTPAAFTVTGCTPNVLQKDGARTFSVSGTGFAPGAAVTAVSGNGITITSSTRNSDVSITVQVGISNGAQSNVRAVTVTNGAGQTVVRANCLTVTD